MKKAWRNERQIIIHQLPEETVDAQRLNRLISLLAIGMERLVSEQANNDVSKTVDFQANIAVNTRNLK